MRTRESRDGRVRRRLLESHRGDELDRLDERVSEISELGERQSRLSGASLRIDDGLKFNTFLRGVADSAMGADGLTLRGNNRP